MHPGVNTREYTRFLWQPPQSHCQAILSRSLSLFLSHPSTSFHMQISGSCLPQESSLETTPTIRSTIGQQDTSKRFSMALLPMILRWNFFYPLLTSVIKVLCSLKDGWASLMVYNCPHCYCSYLHAKLHYTQNTIFSILCKHAWACCDYIDFAQHMDIYGPQ